MKRRLKPFYVLSQWQKNRRLRQDLSDLLNVQNNSCGDITCMDVAVPNAVPNEGYNIEKRPMKNSSFYSHCTDFSDIQEDSNNSSHSNEHFKDNHDFTEDIENDFNIEIMTSVDKTFSSELKLWAISNNISHVALSQLLTLFKKYYPNEKIPRDVRAFLDTPRKCIIRKCGIGEFLYYGIEKAILENVKDTADFTNNLIKIDVSIDGLPISKSTGRQLWPIQCRFINAQNSYHPFIVAIYHAMSKPSSVEDFLNEFVNEYCILRDEGFYVKDKHYVLRIRAVM